MQRSSGGVLMKSKSTVKVGVVAADPLRLLGLETILQETLGLDTVGLTISGVARERKLSALLIDVHTCGDALTEIIARLRHDRTELKIVVVGESLDPEVVQSVIGAGAKGYLAETADEREIAMAMEVVLDGSVWAPRKVLARLIDASGIGSAGPAAGEGIATKMTPREYDVLQQLMDGRSNRDIAKAMGIDEVTVKAHLGRMLRKSGVNNRVELTLRAMEERASRDTKAEGKDAKAAKAKR